MSTGNEALIVRITEEVKKSLSKLNGNDKMIPLGVSNRHIHITEATFKKLFGANAQFEVMRTLYQPGEVALTDARTLGINPPVVNSGDLDTDDANAANIRSEVSVELINH